jgi:hypothetical protein
MKINVIGIKWPNVTLFSLKVNFIGATWIRIRRDQLSFSKLYPHSLKKLDLDLHKFNADPKH